MRNLKYTISIIIAAFWLIAFSNSFGQTDKQSLLEDLEEIMSRLEKYEYGESRTWMKEYYELMREIHKQKDIFPKVESQFLRLLKSDAGIAAKQFICYELRYYASDESLPVLKKMMKDKNTAEIALTSLEAIDNPEVNDILFRELKRSEGKLKAGILITLGKRNPDKTFETISSYVQDEDPLVRKAAITALGEIGSSQAVEFLIKNIPESEAPNKWEMVNSLLLCAEKLEKQNNNQEAENIYSRILEWTPPPTLKYAAYLGKVNLMDAGKVNYLYEAIKNENREMRIFLIPLVRELPSKVDTKPFLSLWTELDNEQKIQLMLALADRKDQVIHDKVIESLDHPEKEMQMAGLKALLSIGTVYDIPILASVAAENRGAVRELARTGLYRLSGDKIDQAIISSIPAAGVDVQVELIRSIGERNMISETETVLELAEDENRKVKMEALEVLGKIATPALLPDILEIATGLSSSRELQEAEKTITLLAQKIEDTSENSNLILTNLEKADNKDVKIMLIHVLGNLGNEKAYPILEKYLNNEDLEIKQAAIEAFTVWPNVRPAEELRKIIQETDNPKIHILSLRGYAELIQNSEKHTEGEKAELLKEALTLSSYPGEKKTVLSALGTVGSIDALKTAVEFLDNEDLEAEAKAAILNIASLTGDTDPEYTIQILNELLNITTDDDFRDEIRERLKWLEN